MNKKVASILALATSMVFGQSAFGQTAESFQTQSGTIGPAQLAQPDPSRMPGLRQLRLLRESARVRTHLPGPPLPGSDTINTAPPLVPPTTPMDLSQRVGPQPAPLAPGDVLLFNTPLGPNATGGSTSFVGEPSVGNSGAVVFQSGNWYGSLALDDGNTFVSVNPYTTFPASDGGFCCDQIVVYDPSRDLIFWLLQYLPDTARNRLRLAVAKGLDTVVSGSAAWWFYDFISDASPFGFTGQWFDFPDLSVGNNFLYVTTNVYAIAPPQPFTRTVIMRLPLDPLSQGAGFSPEFFSDTMHFAFKAAQGIRSTAYWAAHNSTSSIRIFRWDEGTSAIFSDDRTITPWNDLVRVCPGPDGRDWCGRAQGKIRSSPESVTASV